MKSRSVKKSASTAILEQLAAQNRRVLSDWRAALLMRRATLSLSPSERRWEKAPTATKQIHPILRQMERRGEIQPFSSLSRIYEVIVPYSRMGIIEENEILMEINPFAALSYISALAFHGLTEEFPRLITTLVPAAYLGDILPLGTTVEDWEGLALIRGHQPTHILETPVKWKKVKNDRFFGTLEYHPHGYPIRVTTVERTLIDGILQPDLSGGIINVLRAWARARDIVNVALLISFTTRFNIAVLDQRVGFILEDLGLEHPALEKWQRQAQRGGSSKLLASQPYGTRFSERWNLALNGPIEVLHEGLV